MTRILSMKEKMGLFKKDNHAIALSEKDREFVKNTQKNVAEKSVTLMRDDADIFPLTTEKFKKIAVIPITHHIPAFDEGKLLADLLGEKGFDVQYLKDGIKRQKQTVTTLFCTRSSRARSDRSDFWISTQPRRKRLQYHCKPRLTKRRLCRSARRIL